MSTNRPLFRGILAALFAALIFVATAVVRIPLPFGYANLGDAVVLLSGWLLGPWYGALAAGIGSMLADLISYPVYAPITLLIKGGMALLVGWLAAKKPTFSVGHVLGGLLAEGLMVGGYFAFECVLYGVAAASVGVPFNSLQGVVGLAAGLLLFPLLSKLIRKIR